MAHRSFVDTTGIVWDVWDVHPRWMERRALTGATGSAGAPLVERRRGDDGEPRVKGDPALAGGWLAFESARGRRRLAPLPADWDQLSDGALTRLLDAARQVQPADGASREGR